MIYEYELKYRTQLDKDSFLKLLLSDSRYKLTIARDLDTYWLPIEVLCSDTYYYNPNNSRYFMRLRKEPSHKLLTFKEENIDITCRKEVNIPANKISLHEIKTIASIQGLTKKFKINKEIVVLIMDNLLAEFSWYQVNSKDCFIEVEFIGDQEKYNAKEELESLKHRMVHIFGKKIQREYNSLFKLYKPQPKPLPECKL